MDAQEELAGPNSTVQSALLASILQAAQEQPCVSSTDGQDAFCLPGFTCYVCNQPGNAERLTTCMSAPVYRRLTAGDNQQLIDSAIASSDPLLQQMLQSGKAGTIARQIEGAKHCQRHFHQTCLDRRKEAVFDNRVTIAKKLKDDTQEVRVKDLRHRLCAECLQLEHGSLETHYTGVLDGKQQWQRSPFQQLHNLFGLRPDQPRKDSMCSAHCHVMIMQHVMQNMQTSNQHVQPIAPHTDCRSASSAKLLSSVQLLCKLV